MKTEIESIVLNEGHVHAVINVSGYINTHSPTDYELKRRIEDKIVSHIADKWIADHAVEVMKAIDTSAIVNMVSLRAAKILKD